MNHLTYHYFLYGITLMLVVQFGCQNRLINKKMPNNKLIITKQDTVFEFEIHKKLKSFPTNDDRTYTWTKGNTISSTQGAYLGRILHGPYKVYTRAKMLLVSGEFNKGTKHGEWKHWQINGNLQYITTWQHGEATSKTTYSPDGKIISKAKLKDGMLHGKVITYDSLGNATTNFYDDGNVTADSSSSSFLSKIFKKKEQSKNSIKKEKKTDQSNSSKKETKTKKTDAKKKKETITKKQKKKEKQRKEKKDAEAKSDKTK